MENTATTLRRPYKSATYMPSPKAATCPCGHRIELAERAVEVAASSPLPAIEYWHTHCWQEELWMGKAAYSYVDANGVRKVLR